MAETIYAGDTVSIAVTITVQASREALGVPPDYVIRDVAQGFVAPPEKAQEREA